MSRTTTTRRARSRRRAGWLRPSRSRTPALAELAACLVAYNASRAGTVTSRSVWRGFEIFSFGQKKHPSPFVTA